MVTEKTSLIYYGIIDGLRVYGNPKSKRLEIHLQGDIFGDIFSDWKKRNKSVLTQLKSDLLCLAEEMLKK